jgi:ribosomal protein L21E
MAAGQLVEATYLRAVPNSGNLYLDADGNTVTVTELLPVFIRREVATRVSAQLYTFNTLGRTVKTTVNPSIYVGAKLVTYGTTSGATVNFTANNFSLAEAVRDPTTRVLISYAVLEAVGGETSYTVSQGPVWRPPFSLTARASTLKSANRR